MGGPNKERFVLCSLWIALLHRDGVAFPIEFHSLSLGAHSYISSAQGRLKLPRRSGLRPERMLPCATQDRCRGLRGSVHFSAALPFPPATLAKLINLELIFRLARLVASPLIANRTRLFSFRN